MVYVNNGLVGVDIAVANLQIEMAIGIRTYPGLEMDGRALASEIRKRHKIAVAAVLAFGKTRIHFAHNHILTLGITNAQSRDQF